jgi:hypothetical protein
MIPKHGQDFSPRELICREQKLDYKAICKLPFGAYAQVHEDLENFSRTTGALNLGPTGNVQGTHA